MTDTARFLDTLAARLAQNVSDVESLAALPPEARRFVPASGRWNIDQCLDHLVITADLYHPNFEKALAAASSGPKSTYRPGILGGRFARWAGPESTMKMKAPKAFQSPAGGIEGDPAARLLARLEAMGGFLEASRQIDLGKVRISMPVPLLSLRLGDCLALQIGHQARHIAQAQRLMQDPQFPG